MILANAKICDEHFCLINADIALEGEYITQIGPEIRGDDDRINLSGCMILPGLVDLHIHGCAGADSLDNTQEALHAMSVCLANLGITSFCPTTMTIPFSQLQPVLENVRDFMLGDPIGARVVGVHLEGPFISREKCCAHHPEHVQSPDWKAFQGLAEAFPGMIRIVDVAPENPGAMDFIQKARDICTVSLSHSAADYDTAARSFSQGVTHATHLFNAMNGIHHRSPGAVCAVFDNDQVMAELICDGVHVHPSVLRLACRMLGEDRSIIVSDSMRAAGLPDGAYDLGGQEIQVRDGKTNYADGRLAGSTSNIYQEFLYLLRIGIPWKQAVKSATINPARQLGLDDMIGSIRVGKYADLLVVDQSMAIRSVYIHGKKFT